MYETVIVKGCECPGEMYFPTAMPNFVEKVFVGFASIQTSDNIPIQFTKFTSLS